MRRAPRAGRIVAPQSAPSQAPITLRIEKQVYGGSGLSRVQGQVIFTPLTLTDETVSAVVTNSRKSFAEASLTQVLEPSAERTAPPCPHFGVCGGCHYQHATYPEQMAIKLDILAETLERAGLRNLPPVTSHTGAPLGYRNRIRLHIDPATSELGYRERGSHRLLVIDQCPIAMPVLVQAFRALRELSVASGWGRHSSEIELSANHDASQVILEVRRSDSLMPLPTQSEWAQTCTQLQQKVPELRGAVISSDSGLTIASWGEPWMAYRVGRRTYHLSAGAFFQVNHALIEPLVALAIAGREGRLAWDLYAGVGLFSLALAERFAEVIAVEGAPASARDLRENAESIRATAAGRCAAVEQSTLEFLRSRTSHRSSLQTAARPRPDFILVDPPRTGLGPEVTALLIPIRAPHVTYVSCDPSTLSRDLRTFVESGYQIEALHLIDLFPQTFHIETVAMLSLG